MVCSMHDLSTAFSKASKRFIDIIYYDNTAKSFIKFINSHIKIKICYHKINKLIMNQSKLSKSYMIIGGLPIKIFQSILSYI